MIYCKIAIGFNAAFYLVNEHIAPSVRALKIFDITQVTTTEALQFRHAVLGPG